MKYVGVCTGCPYAPTYEEYCNGFDYCPEAYTDKARFCKRNQEGGVNMEKINYFDIIREYLNKITGISNKLATDITEKDLAKLDAYSCGIWAILDYIESDSKEE